MFNLSENHIHLSAQAANKQHAIEQVAQVLEQAGYVATGYSQAMLARENQTSTFLGNGIAIPHGTLETRDLVQQTGVQVFQFPQGIQWDEENTAYVVIGIAARSDEHLALLRQLTQVLGDEEKANKLANLQDVATFRAILMGEEDFAVKSEDLSLDLDTQSLLALTAINAGKLEQQQAVNSQFVADVIASPALPLGQGIWLTDSTVGNLKNALAFSRAKTPFENNGKSVKGVLTIAAVNDQINDSLARLLDPEVQQQLLNGNEAQILQALNGNADQSQLEVRHSEESATHFSESFSASQSNKVIGTFTIRNEHGLHARPSAVLVNEVKKFDAQIQVENLSRNSAPVSAKSLMKIVALGVTQGHRLRVVAEGEQAQQAIEAIGKAIAEGLGETPSAIALQEADSIEILSAPSSTQTPTNAATAPVASAITTNAEGALEAVFVINNEHGLHARPSAVLVNEVKKYNAAIAVQNLDRHSQLVSAKSLMKIVALGVVKGHRLRFVASGDEAQQALEGIGKAIEAGLGE